MPYLPPSSASSIRHIDVEMHLLLDAIFVRYHCDFRAYAGASLKRRLLVAMSRFNCTTLSQLQDQVLHEPAMFPALMDYLTVQVSDMFRDPAYFRCLRHAVVPLLRTYPSLKVWVAGCSTGEEAYSLAILLSEEGLLGRTRIYATDIHPGALKKAESGVYPLERIAGFTSNHQQSGALTSLSDYYTAGYGFAVFDKRLRQHIVFSDHCLATDNVFAEMQLISCRNVLIYFTRPLQERALSLFHQSLCRKGFLGLGSKETLRFSGHAAGFDELARNERIFQKNGRHIGTTDHVASNNPVDVLQGCAIVPETRKTPNECPPGITL